MTRIPSHSQILRMAAPIVVANCAVPLLGLVDTAVIGNLGGTSDLGAIALGALIFSFVFWGFGFLRMGTTGFTAQAVGAGDSAEVRAGLARALLLGTALGLGLTLAQQPISATALTLFDASADVEQAAERYFAIRIWGAPAALGTYALTGLFIGLGRSRQVLHLQLLMNGLNIALDLLFAGGLGWGVEGIALGTALAEWSALTAGLWMAWNALSARHTDAEPFWPWPRIRDRERFRRMLAANGDIMIRTLLMLAAFAGFTNQGARFGDATLAANHILLQFVSFSAFFLDGFAFAAEALVGRALGARRLDAFDAAVRRSSALSAATAILLAGGIAVFGGPFVNALTDLAAVRAVAGQFLPYAAAYVLLSFAAFQLDGVFIGSTRTRAMRNASALSVAGFALAWWLLDGATTNRGLWLAFIVYVVLRALTLGAAFPGLRADLKRPPPA